MTEPIKARYHRRGKSWDTVRIVHRPSNNPQAYQPMVQLLLQARNGFNECSIELDQDAAYALANLLVDYFDGVDHGAA